jgi:hypothetical protein
VVFDAVGPAGEAAAARNVCNLNWIKLSPHVAPSDPAPSSEGAQAGQPQGSE